MVPVNHGGAGAGRGWQSVMCTGIGLVACAPSSSPIHARREAPWSNSGFCNRAIKNEMMQNIIPLCICVESV